MLNRRLALPRAEIWSKFLKLWNWKDLGLVSTVDRKLADYTEEMIDAFLEFRRGYEERMADNRKRAEEREALRREIDRKKERNRR